MTTTEAARTTEANAGIAGSTPGVDAGRPGSFNEYRLGPNDRILVDVFGVETFSGEYRVDEGGEISLPLLGPIRAAGYTPLELTGVIEARLRESYMRDPRVSIQVVTVVSRGVSVIGAVRRPGLYQLAGGATLLEALAMAEGLTETAGHNLFVYRETTPGVIEVDLVALLQLGTASANLALVPGDIVQVRTAGTIYVVGQVGRPGEFPMPTGAPITVLQALAMAGGLSRTAKASRAYIVREGVDGARHEIAVDLAGMLEGSVRPAHILDRDVLNVPNNRTKALFLASVGAAIAMFTFRGVF